MCSSMTTNWFCLIFNRTLVHCSGSSTWCGDFCWRWEKWWCISSILGAFEMIKRPNRSGYNRYGPSLHQCGTNLYPRGDTGIWSFSYYQVVQWETDKTTSRTAAGAVDAVCICKLAAEWMEQQAKPIYAFSDLFWPDLAEQQAVLFW